VLSLRYQTKLTNSRKIPAKMPSLTTTYLIPALFLNPAFVLHIINTFVSHFVPSPLTISHSPHPFMESIGPVPGSTLYLDMHADNQLCWRYTAVMVVVQLLAFGRVSDNRGQRKAKRAARLERERLKNEKLGKCAGDKKKPICISPDFMDGACDIPENTPLRETNGHANGTAGHPAKRNETEGEESTTETSEEEMIV
jgi:hypothetical protein